LFKIDSLTHLKKNNLNEQCANISQKFKITKKNKLKIKLFSSILKKSFKFFFTANTNFYRIFIYMAIYLNAPQLEQSRQIKKKGRK